VNSISYFGIRYSKLVWTTTMKKLFLLIAMMFIFSNQFYSQQNQTKELTSEEKILSAFHSISSNTILDYIKELCSDKFEGRLTGSKGYDTAAEWSISLFKKWGLKLAGDAGTFLQKFSNPYTLVLDAGELSLNNANGKKYYEYEKEYYSGATSDAGTATAEVVYVGYGITAPELGYDYYANVDVKGKIVLLNPEIPISPDREPELFMKWRPYSFHDYKVKNAFDHGAVGMLYNYHIVNPNCIFIKGFLKADIGKAVTDDIFSGTGKTIDDCLKLIRTERKPQSFNTAKIVTIKCNTKHFPDGIGTNVIGKIEGTDPVLKDNPIIIGAHLDHLGMSHKLMPGANDNASGDAALFAIAEAFSKVKLTFKRSIIFILFGAEEQGVKGSEFYLKHPNVPAADIKAFINLESVGRGENIGAGSGKNYPNLFEYFERANNKFVHRVMTASQNANLARPRQDAAHFLWAGVPTISFGVYGAPPLDVPTYHTTHDIPDYIFPETIEDLAKIVFLATLEMANE